MGNKVDLYDLCALFGLACVVYGVSRWSVPAAWVLCGLVLLAASCAPLLRKGKS